MSNFTIQSNKADAWRQLKVGMKRTQRVSIEFQHREVTLTVAGSIFDLRDHVPFEGGPDTSTVCSICGSPWISIVVGTGEEMAATAHVINCALGQAGVHLHVTPAGELQICRKSLEAIKEKL